MGAVFDVWVARGRRTDGGLAVQSRAVAEIGVCAPPDEEFAAAEECDAPVATGVMPTGLWR